MKNDQKPVSWCYKVRCTHCGAASSFDWSIAHKSAGMGYEMTCPACGKLFNFKQWQYVSTCPGCNHSFEVTMHSVTMEMFAHQHKCKWCNGLLNCSKDSPPHFIDISKTLVISLDASKAMPKQFTQVPDVQCSPANPDLSISSSEAEWIKIVENNNSISINTDKALEQFIKAALTIISRDLPNMTIGERPAWNGETLSNAMRRGAENEGHLDRDQISIGDYQVFMLFKLLHFSGLEAAISQVGPRQAYALVRLAAAFADPNLALKGQMFPLANNALAWSNRVSEIANTNCDATSQRLTVYSIGPKLRRRLAAPALLRDGNTPPSMYGPLLPEPQASCTLYIPDVHVLLFGPPPSRNNDLLPRDCLIHFVEALKALLVDNTVTKSSDVYPCQDRKTQDFFEPLASYLECHGASRAAKSLRKCAEKSPSSPLLRRPPDISRINKQPGREASRDDWSRTPYDNLIMKVQSMRTAPSEETMFDVFVSYKSEDVSLVRPVAELLIANGLRVWFAEYLILLSGRERFQDVVDFGLRNCRYGIVFTNSGYFVSDHCRHELRELLSSHRCGPENILQVRLSPTADETSFPILRLCKTFDYKDNPNEILTYFEKTIGTRIPVHFDDSFVFSNRQESILRDNVHGFSIDVFGWTTIKSSTEKYASVPTPRLIYERHLGAWKCNWNLIVDTPAPALRTIPRKGHVIDDRSCYEQTIKVANIILGNFGTPARGVHLLLMGDYSQFAISYWFINHWVRRYSVVLPNPKTGESTEFAFTFGFFGPFRKFCRYTHLMDQVVASLVWE